MDSFLVIRRDNIGDLVCTLPLIVALRKRHPKARIEALVNSYNRDVLQGHPALDAVHAYTKGKHREDESLPSPANRRFVPVHDQDDPSQHAETDVRPARNPK